MKTTLYRYALEHPTGPIATTVDHPMTADDYHLIDTVEVDLPPHPTQAQMLEAIAASKARQKEQAA
ncbi:hypothetical protein GCM10011348_46290 [Marinobacterium nitratireducens]|uniref:Uncharacterized protein n=1 Tax=Marinobacterium nitratireducens TaxID=518897 RepID=A0A917ZSR8_9GAMM|nr:hypothetical protein [Marinobacterium nitratireducens]GGO89169.1 hypothetical protein GCM10011348_46290 [Marinobacterium nitratireducens]